jgi:hypothetical protein
MLSLQSGWLGQAVLRSEGRKEPRSAHLGFFCERTGRRHCRSLSETNKWLSQEGVNKGYKKQVGTGLRLKVESTRFVNILVQGCKNKEIKLDSTFQPQKLEMWERDLGGGKLERDSVAWSRLRLWLPESCRVCLVSPVCVWSQKGALAGVTSVGLPAQRYHLKP